MNRNLERFTRDLRTLHIQGATAVAHETLRALEEYARSLRVPTSVRAWRALQATGAELASLRPTEPLARNLVRWYLTLLRGGWISASTRTSWQQHVSACAQEIRYALKEAEARVVAHGAKLVKLNETIFTHCHSSLAELILTGAKQAGRRFQVYHTETRPLYQGHITDERLRRAGIPTTMVVDSAAAYLISNHSGDDVKVSWVLLGADSLARDGSVINKIGSFGIALAAHDSHIPVYVAATLLKIDATSRTKIELRSGNEVWPNAPGDVKIVNYAFDRVPPKFVSGLICEFGVVKPERAWQLARQHYPWLMKQK